MENTHGLNVVLVHGGWVDGSGWEGVHNILTRDGHHVSVVQIPTVSLADDVMATRRVIGAQDGRVILVGHSYGGAVITEAGNDPKVAGLVYVAAFAPDKGESVASLIKDPPPDAPVPPILPPQDGYLLLDRTKFGTAFAADVDPRKGCVHGRFAGAVGSSGPQRHDRRTGVENEAELVPGRYRRQDDPTSGAALHVQTGRFHRHRGSRQPRRLCITARRCRRAHRAGRPRLDI